MEKRILSGFDAFFACNFARTGVSYFRSKIFNRIAVKGAVIYNESKADTGETNGGRPRLFAAR
jgi:hypothetical protein